jgi:acyl carrier protein
MPEPPSTIDDLSRWLAQRVAGYLHRDPVEIDHDTLFADYGLDSVYALTFCADIEDALGVTVADTVVWDYPTIRELAAHLVSLADAQGSAAR